MSTFQWIMAALLLFGPTLGVFIWLAWMSPSSYTDLLKPTVYPVYPAGMESPITVPRDRSTDGDMEPANGPHF